MKCGRRKKREPKVTYKGKETGNNQGYFGDSETFLKFLWCVGIFCAVKRSTHDIIQVMLAADLIAVNIITEILIV